MHGKTNLVFFSALLRTITSHLCFTLRMERKKNCGESRLKIDRQRVIVATLGKRYKENGLSDAMHSSSPDIQRRATWKPRERLPCDRVSILYPRSPSLIVLESWGVPLRGLHV